MDSLLELGGLWLARAYAYYGIFLLAIPAFFFLYTVLLVAIVLGTVQHSRGRQLWPWLPLRLRRWGRLAIEIAFGLINPVIYLAVFMTALPGLAASAGWWRTPLVTAAWILLAAFWTLRVFGAALDGRRRVVRAAVRGVLIAALVCLAVFAIKDAALLFTEVSATVAPVSLVLVLVRVAPLYLIPAVFLWDYLRSAPTPSPGSAAGRNTFFLLPGRGARVAVAVAVGLALATAGLAAYRRSPANVRELVSSHRDAIRTVAAQYDVDPRLIASIVYVTHRDQLSPFRSALERVVVSAWAVNLRRALGNGPPERIEVNGTDENPLLNRSLDISVGLAQIKPRTAQAASILATGRTPDELPRPEFYAYRDIEPVGTEWRLPSAQRVAMASPIPVPAERAEVATRLLDPHANLAMCGLILALYQRQWETADPGWSLRGRPDILATLYQIGLARSKPHGAPQSNEFSIRVRQIYEEPWVSELFQSAPR